MSDSICLERGQHASLQQVLQKSFFEETRNDVQKNTFDIEI